jgi:hypothetical protein
MSIISGTTKKETHETYETRAAWSQAGSVYTYVVESRTNTTNIWTAVLDAITAPAIQGSGDVMVSKDFVPRINGWYDYTESWVTYGTWTT